MSAQPSLFDPPEASRRKRTGIATAKTRSARWVQLAQATARRIAHQRGTVTADDVREALYPANKPAHYNAMGSVFANSSGLIWTGEFRKSKTPQGHSNLQRVWRLK